MIEAPFAFLEIEMEVLPGDAVVSAQVSFCLAPEVLDAVYMVASIRKAATMVDALMSKL